MSSTPEGRVKASIKRYFKKIGFILAGEPIPKNGCKGWYYMPSQSGYGASGILDFVCCWNGRFLAIETKAPGNHEGTTPNQKLRIAEIKSANGVALVIDDISQLKEFMENEQQGRSA